MVSSVRIRAFRAPDDSDSSHRFMEGHRRVLDIFGIKKVTSSNEEWGDQKNVFVILVDSPDGKRVYGGARIHVADGIHRLPVEDATGDMDPQIYKMVDQFSKEGCGELCGLWNSREVAGLGVGSFFATRAGIVISQQIGIKYLFALCAPYTVKFSKWMGCEVVESLGNNGTFYYPKVDLLATVVLLEDTQSLQTANPSEREKVFDLRKKPVQLVTEKVRGHNRTVSIQYELSLENVSTEEFKIKAKEKGPKQKYLSARGQYSRPYIFTEKDNK